ncbi:hypothetical protein GEV27_14770 [Aeromicrobium sp. S22]|uniref:hypothetical protein n=1 Tax=Aeromicrobium sp. S22 TaxID=2662029 RepID=UPI00129DB49B|nr:hypothetical protein [Aeromicrobium sp. S22]MRK02779.1 hypothetical protein [Aeromicrobium sp. S22]
MPRPLPVPDELASRPFTAAEARALGLSEKVLRGSRFRRVFVRVWVHRDHVMTREDWITAASLAVPERAHLSHVTRLQALGLDVGPERPFHFTVAGDLHIALDDMFVHRTEVLPPLDSVGVTPAAAFIQYCSTARLIDAIKVGDWLLYRQYATIVEIAELAARDPWRPGASQARRVLPHLEPESRSLKESETRALVVFSGLPVPESNVDLVVRGKWLGCVDLLFRLWMLVLEYEGRQHAESIEQFGKDLARYAGFRDESVAYLQVTNPMLQRPRALVGRVHRMLVERGYDGPEPVFARRWASLFRPIPSEGGAMASTRVVKVDASAPRRGRGVRP